ncbi:sulfatase [Gemmatimonadota bacterium]
MKNLSRREFAHLSTAATVGALLSGTQSCTKQEKSKATPKGPNVIFFMTDDQRWDGLSRAGNPYFKTPNLDRIANEGAYFTNSFVTNSLCGPSRATCFTGKYSHNTGVKLNERYFPRDQETILEAAGKNGYRTAFVGKWHNKPWGRDRKLDYYFGFKYQGLYHDPLIRENDGEDKKYQGWVEDILADKTIDFIKRNKDEPFFICHWFKTPHQNCDPAERHKDLYKDVKFERPSTFDTDYAGKPRAVREADMKIGGTGSTSYVQDFDEFMRNYYRVLTGVDENVGRILDLLDEMGLAENTIVLFTSDNGYFLGEHGFFDKRLMYEPSLRIPLLVRYPKAIKPGTVIDEFALNVDYAPTLLDYAGITVPEDVDGRSLRPLLEGREVPDWRQDFLYEYYAYPDWHYVRPNKGVRTRKWKYIHYYDFPRDEYELYDLENDPEEVHNLVEDPRYADVVESLQQRLYELRKESHDPDLKYEYPI